MTGSNTGGSSTATLTLSVNLPPPPAAPAVTLDSCLSAGRTGFTASTQDQGPGMSYAWSLTGGSTVTAGQGTPGITFTTGAAGPLTASVTVSNPGGSANGQSSATVVPLPSAELQLPPSAHPGDAWMQASVPAQAGTFSWSILPGSTTGALVSGQDTNIVRFSAGAAGTFQIEATVTNQAGDSATAVRTVTVQNGTWLIENGAALPRAYATATLLPSGRVLVAGGLTTTGVPLDRSEIFDPGTGTWTSTVGRMGIARSRHTATLLPDGTVLVAGGFGASAYQASCERFDPVAGTWTLPVGNLGTARMYHAATSLANGKILVTGGLGNAGVLAGCEVYDPSAGTWSAIGGLLTARFNHGAVALPDGTVLVVGGQGAAGEPLTSCERYDPATGAWSPTGDLAGSPVSEFTTTLLGDGSVMLAFGSADITGIYR